MVLASFSGERSPIPSWSLVASESALCCWHLGLIVSIRQRHRWVLPPLWIGCPASCDSNLRFSSWSSSKVTGRASNLEFQSLEILFSGSRLSLGHLGFDWCFLLSFCGLPWSLVPLVASLCSSMVLVVDNWTSLWVFFPLFFFVCSIWANWDRKGASFILVALFLSFHWCVARLAWPVSWEMFGLLGRIPQTVGNLAYIVLCAFKVALNWIDSAVT